MANVATGQTAKQRRDTAQRLLPVLIAGWRELPEIAAEIDTWEIGEAQIYVEEWPHSETIRREIEWSADAGVLTAEQMEQLAELRQLVAEHKPTLDQLLGVK